MIIGLAGPKGVGKSTIAQLYKNKGWEIVSFATPIKEMTVALLLEAGLSINEALLYTYSNKNHYIDVIGTTSRKVQQALHHLKEANPDIYLNIAKSSIEHHIQRGKSVVIDDVRFQPEVDMICKLGGEVIELLREGVSYTHEHVSECGDQLTGIHHHFILSDNPVMSFKMIEGRRQ